MTKGRKQQWKIEKHKDIFNMEINRICTAGSVDDGKSTLIGRILYDTHSIAIDQIENIKATSAKRGKDFLDLSLLTDGLIAEREQGITIDVAHLYFHYNQKKYIIADSPGHIEYTRNMVTGASNCHSSIILIDARNGVLEQSKRHLAIMKLMGISNIIVAVNKMDLIAYNEDAFKAIKSEVLHFAQGIELNINQLRFIPISAKYGINVVNRSEDTPWYSGPSILEAIDDLSTTEFESASRFLCQTVIRPQTEELHDYRGIAGKVLSGSLKIGDEILVYPSMEQARISNIHIAEKQLEIAEAPLSVNIELDKDIDVSRGSLVVPIREQIKEEKLLSAQMCWVNKTAFQPGKTYILQSQSRKTKAKLKEIEYKLNLNNFNKESSDSILLNDIVSASFKLANPMYLEAFDENRANGSFILIDPQTNQTMAVGMVN